MRGKKPKNSYPLFKEFAKGLLVFMGFLIVLVSLVWLKMSTIRLSYQLSSEYKIKANLKEQQQQLVLNLAELKSPRHLRQSAKKMNFKSPTQK